MCKPRAACVSEELCEDGQIMSLCDSRIEHMRGSLAI